jgi:serine/threonine protein kinase, bacterial
LAPQVQGTALLTKAQALFEREAGVMYRLQHPQIPMFREMFRVNRSGEGQLFLVQDYVDGVNYQQLLKQKLQQGQGFVEAEIVEFLTQILPVLGYIHSLGVIHRDISPDNLIRRNSDGQPVLIDFGGVKQVSVNAATQYMSVGTNHSDVPTRLGKVGYAPNEQMQRGVVFPHSDLYALAATTLVLLTGKEPPDLIDPQNFTWNWREHITLSPNLASVLDRMLQLRPNDRFETAQVVLAALKSGNSINLSSMSSNPPPPPVKTYLPDPAASQMATVAAVKQSISPPTVATPSTANLMTVVGKTWMTIAAIVGAVGLGWFVASLTTKRPTAIQSQPRSNVPEPQSSETPIATTKSAVVPTPAGMIPLAEIEPTLPLQLANKGVNARAYGNVVKAVFIGQNPQLKLLKSDENRIRSQLDNISLELGDRLNARLNSDAIRKIGSYSMTDRSNWRSQIHKLHLSDRALINLTDAKYRTITDLSAQKLGMSFDRFLTTAIGQVYLASMADRIAAIQARTALDEIVFPIGGIEDTVSGTLHPGEGKAYIASLAKGQDVRVDITTADRLSLSIYPPTSKLSAILTDSSTSNWAGKTELSGYYEFVLISRSDRPISYKLKLTALDLKPTHPTQNKDRSLSVKPDRQPIW